MAANDMITGTRPGGVVERPDQDSNEISGGGQDEALRLPVTVNAPALTAEPPTISASSAAKAAVSTPPPAKTALPVPEKASAGAPAAHEKEVNRILEAGMAKIHEAKTPEDKWEAYTDMLDKLPASVPAPTGVVKGLIKAAEKGDFEYVNMVLDHHLSEVSASNQAERTKLFTNLRPSQLQPVISAANKVSGDESVGDIFKVIADIFTLGLAHKSIWSPTERQQAQALLDSFRHQFVSFENSPSIDPAYASIPWIHASQSLGEAIDAECALGERPMTSAGGGASATKQWSDTFPGIVISENRGADGKLTSYSLDVSQVQPAGIQDGFGYFLTTVNAFLPTTPPLATPQILSSPELRDAWRHWNSDGKVVLPASFKLGVKPVVTQDAPAPTAPALAPGTTGVAATTPETKSTPNVSVWDWPKPNGPSLDEQAKRLGELGLVLRTPLSATEIDKVTKALQSFLKGLNNKDYDPGLVDGRPGPATRTAIAKYLGTERNAGNHLMTALAKAGATFSAD